MYMQTMNHTILRHFMIITLIFALIPFFIPASAQRTRSSLSAGKQRNAEKGLKDNRYFFYFINTSITNLGDEEEKTKFKEAIQRDIIAQNLYMKFLFGESFEEIRKAQRILIGLYRINLGRDIDMSKQLLNSLAPSVVKTNDYLARHYLHLGYRDAADAQIDMIMADNFQEFLYSMRLYRYAKAIKKVKHGKRYALFSLLQSQTEKNKKKTFSLLGYEELKKLISDVSPSERKEFYLLIHTDNYYKSKDEKSFFDRVWEKPDLFEIKEYQEYLKMN